MNNIFYDFIPKMVVHRKKKKFLKYFKTLLTVDLWSAAIVSSLLMYALIKLKTKLNFFDNPAWSSI